MPDHNHTDAGELYQPAVGDRVRVTLEGEVTYTTAPDDFDLGPLASVFKVGATTSDRVVSVEKIKPPVETFQPGDVVRSIYDAGLTFALSQRGYTRLCGGSFRTYADDEATPGLARGCISRSQFHSDRFERVVI